MKCWGRFRIVLNYYGRRHNSTATTVSLRPYQEDCLEACTTALSSGSTRIGVSLPTGSGKTTVFISLLDRIKPPPENPDATKALIIVNTIELARQSAARATRMFPHWTVEIEQGVKHQATGLADVTVATYQTLNSEERSQKFDPKLLKAIIVDEAHHAAAPSYRRLLARFHPEIKSPGVEAEANYNVPVVGFSATFGRHDGLALGSVFERIVYHRDLEDMMSEEWLCKVKLTSVKADINLQKVSINSVNGDFNSTSLAGVMNTDVINTLLIKSWILHASQEKSTLVFCVNIAHVNALTDAFRAAGIDARSISGKTPADQRKATVQAFREGQFPVLLNCAILTEGADIPNIDCVILARPTRSRNLFAQMIGRGMRLSPETGKVGCRLIDFVDSHNRFGADLAVHPSLFGLDPDKLDENTENRPETVRDEETGGSMTRKEIAEPEYVTFIEHGELFMGNHPSKRQQAIQSLSQLAWVDCGNDLYVLEVLRQGSVRIRKIGSCTLLHLRQGSVRIRKIEGQYISRYNAVVGKIFVKPLNIVAADDLPTVISATETYLRREVFKDPNTLSLHHRSAKWRAKPATDSQKAFVLSLWSQKLSPETTVEQKNEILDTMTKGAIGDMITRLLNGGLGQLRKISLNATKKIKKEAKEELRRSRERVEVGPLRV